MTQFVVTVAPTRTRCRSKSPFGACGLTIRHGGPRHAVPIGDGLWFGYRGGGRLAVAVGYGKFHGRRWCTLPCYCNTPADQLGLTEGERS